MGVPGLWEILRPAAARTSLSSLARDAVLVNKNGLRALTIGIDASIWIFHAQVQNKGENPFLSTIFHKITFLLQHPVLPVFVFDGPRKPTHKRGQYVGGHFGTWDSRSRLFKELLDECGLEWWNAPGEAEAELAVMNRQGKIDAVLSDDVDALLFGATCLLRNNSPTLSGAQASEINSRNSAKPDHRHYEVYGMDAIRQLLTEKEGTDLETEADCQMAMVLIALLGGGDYAPEGMAGFGATIASGLAHAGFTRFLHEYKRDPARVRGSLASIQQRMAEELRTDANKHLGRRYKKLAERLEKQDPAVLMPERTLDAYLKPVTSPLADASLGWPGFGKGERSHTRGKARHSGRGDLEGMAKACERFFEWGTPDRAVLKFAGEAVGLFGSEAMNSAREALCRLPPRRTGESSISRLTGYFPTVSGSSPPRTGKQSSPLRAMSTSPEPAAPKYVGKITLTRPDPILNDIDYRVTVTREPLAERCRRAMTRDRIDPDDLPEVDRTRIGLTSIDDEDKARKAASRASALAKVDDKVWIPGYLVREAWPGLVRAYEKELAAKASKKNKSKKHLQAASKTAKAISRSHATTENLQKFKDFFTQNRPTQGSPLSDDDRVISAMPRSSSFPEHLDSPTHIKTLRHKSPSLPDMRSSSPLTPLSSKPSSPSPIAWKNSRSSATSSHSASPAPPPRAGRLVRRVVSPVSNASARPRPAKSSRPSPPREGRSSGKGSKPPVRVEVIDLCSDSDDEPSPLPRRSPRRVAGNVLGRTTRANVQKAPSSPPSPKSKGTSKTKTGSEKQKSQTILDFPRAIRSSPPRAKSPIRRAPAKAVSYVITYQSDDVEHIDLTRRP